MHKIIFFSCCNSFFCIFSPSSFFQRRKENNGKCFHTANIPEICCHLSSSYCVFNFRISVLSFSWSVSFSASRSSILLIRPLDTTFFKAVFLYLIKIFSPYKYHNYVKIKTLIKKVLKLIGQRCIKTESFVLGHLQTTASHYLAKL